MSNFKVGDKVKFLGFEDSLAEYDGSNQFIGSIGTIIDTAGFYFVDYGEKVNNALTGGLEYKSVLNYEEELELINE